MSGWWSKNWEPEDDLSDEQQAAAETLGWTADTWNNQEMGRAPKVGDGAIFVKKWDGDGDALSDGQREAAETLGYTKETWEDPTTGAIAVSNVVGVDGTPTEVHVPAGAFRLRFSDPARRFARSTTSVIEASPGAMRAKEEVAMASARQFV